MTIFRKNDTTGILMLFNRRPDEIFEVRYKKSDSNCCIFFERKKTIYSKNRFILYPKLVYYVPKSPKRLIFASVKFIKPYNLHLPYFSRIALTSSAVLLVLRTYSSIMTTLVQFQITHLFISILIIIFLLQLNQAGK